ncbi:hypothetical protein EI94DRAFT_1768678 [Lactarius quietus]|nr:hypothetical protein EI94DRAFT_1768678 [Lactarius quietus]
MATKRVADHTLYHLSPKGFWKKFRDAVAVDPAISSGLPLPNLNRQPPPGSRPEKYSTPATKASDPAENPYWKRDVRRAYPQLSVVTQSELSTLLIQHSSPPESVRLCVFRVCTSPTPPTPFKRWIPERAPDAPHDPNAYFP